MSNVGYYRYKVSDSLEGTQTVQFFINGGLAKTCIINARKFCIDFRVIKYLNKNGQYRFFAFNDKWQQSDKPSLIGKTNQFVTSILNSQSDKKNNGYKNERKISLTAETVSLAELESLSDIFVSPCVYLYVGNGFNDNIEDWILVTATGDGISRPKSNKFKKFTLELTLPEYYAITKI